MTHQKDIFTDNVLRLIGLLVGLWIFQGIYSFVVIMIPQDSLRLDMTIHQQLIGNTLFALIIFILNRQQKVMALSIGLLSIASPIFGGLFHLLASLDKTDIK